MTDNESSNLPLDDFLFFFDTESLLWHAVSRYDYDASIKDVELQVNTITATSIDSLLFFITDPNRAIN